MSKGLKHVFWLNTFQEDARHGPVPSRFPDGTLTQENQKVARKPAPPEQGSILHHVLQNPSQNPLSHLEESKPTTQEKTLPKTLFLHYYLSQYIFSEVKGNEDSLICSRRNCSPCSIYPYLEAPE
jgi:hypothetical protein